LAGFYGFGVQTTADAQRLAGIGADPSRIVITGNLKFDQPADDGEVDGPARRVGLGLAPDELLWVAGSTRHGEEEPLLDAYRRLRDRGIPVVLVIAPRHLDRLDKIEAMVRERGFDPVRRSALHMGEPGGRGEGDRARVILLDTIGELAALYGEAAVAFVGGTLVPVGGHNLLEPAARGKVVVFGPHTYKCEEIAAAVLESGAGVRVDSADALAEQVGRLLADPALRERMGRRGREMVARNQGAVERTLALLHPWLVE
jgi:3-deoxy-D-manno-octulosonic-acid transferase